MAEAETETKDAATEAPPAREPRAASARKAQTESGEPKPARGRKPAAAGATSTPKRANGANGSALAAAPAAIRKRADSVIKTVRGGAHDAAEKVQDAAGAVQHAAEGAVKSVKDTVKGALPKRGATTAKSAPKKAPAKSAPKKAPAKSARKGAGTGTVIGIAAAGIAAGVALNLGRKAAVQAPSALAGDWMEALKGEHKAALALFDALQATSDAQAHRRSVLLIQLKHALTKHALTEENVIYPALRAQGEKDEADKLNHEHGYVKDYLYQLELMPNGAPGFLAKVAEFRADLEKHVREEETEVFPALHAKLGEAKNKLVTLAANKEGFKAA